jgi:hypothetical protein
MARRRRGSLQQGVAQAVTTRRRTVTMMMARRSGSRRSGDERARPRRRAALLPNLEARRRLTSSKTFSDVKHNAAHTIAASRLRIRHRRARSQTNSRRLQLTSQLGKEAGPSRHVARILPTPRDIGQALRGGSACSPTRCAQVGPKRCRGTFSRSQLLPAALFSPPCNSAAPCQRLHTYKPTWSDAVCRRSSLFWHC